MSSTPTYVKGDTGPANRPDTKLGTLMRVLFFIAVVIIGSYFIETSGRFLLNSAIVDATVGIFLTGLLANVLTMRIFDRRPLADIGLGNGRGTGRNFGIGLGLAAAAAATLLGLPLLAGAAHIVRNSDASKLGAGTFAVSLVFYLILLLFGAAGEETIFRGYAFQLLVEKLGPFATILPAGVVFGLAHSGNPNVTKLAVANTAFWGILLGYAFLRSRDLWLPIGLHYGWNAVLPLFGAGLSGITIEVTRYTYRWELSPVWSGGNYGPEGGLLTTIFIVVLFIAVAKAPVVPQKAAIAVSLNERAGKLLSDL